MGKPRGGRRPGAGCPRGAKHKSTLAREAAQEYARAFFTRRLEALCGATADAAIGLSVLYARGPEGKWSRVRDQATADRVMASGEAFQRFYLKDPDVQAIKEVFARALGAVPQALRHEDPPGKAIKRCIVILPPIEATT